MEKGVRLQTSGVWVWADQIHCAPNANLDCYFLNETRCHKTKKASIATDCPSIIHDRVSLVEYRAAATEYLFSLGLTNVVLEEVASQLRMVFNQTTAPPHLITVHIRWGDKASEMKLVIIDDYVTAVKTILSQRSVPTAVNVYVATEDPRATAAFRNAGPPTWNVYGDAMVEEQRDFRPNDGNHALAAAKASRGLVGTEALASLVIAMEANDFVLTTGSNWSRLMNELRTNVIDPRCGGCTSMIDLRRGQWR